jgi:RNA 3'-terminal phosphate cyclase (ATP)
MALAGGTSRILVGPLSLHTRTAIHVTSQLTGVSQITVHVRLMQ